MTRPGGVAAVSLAPGASVAEWKSALAQLSTRLGWTDQAGRPFGQLVADGERILVKPNWVQHRNKGPWGLDPLVTSPRLVIATVELLLELRPATVTLGDAPLQGCDLTRLLEHGELGAWAASLRGRDARFVGPEDFRRTVSSASAGALAQSEDVRRVEDFVLVDLGADSLLEPVTEAKPTFRVTQYDPDLMVPRHQPRRHQYLLARAALDATLILNLPKLKTHKKAGVTCALKNLVGLNGNKEYLPHHRIGSPAEGGDCYPRPSLPKRLQERLYDAQNRSKRLWVKRGLLFPILALAAIARNKRERMGLEGAWSGNDTVWRMSLDLNRAARYAGIDGQLRDTPARRIVSLIDAVIAGQGDGPLASEPLAMGLLLGSSDAAAADAVGARLLGYRPEAIPIVRESFSNFRFPLSTSSLGEVLARWHQEHAAADAATPRAEWYPEGWLNAVDRAHRAQAAHGTTYPHREQAVAGSR